MRTDQTKRKRALRHAKGETGVWVYITSDELAKTGIEPGGERPWYRVWGQPRGSVQVRLYRDAT